MDRGTDNMECVAIAIYGTLAEGGWSNAGGSWRDNTAEVEVAWQALPEWERDDYRRSAREALALAAELGVR